MVWAPDYVSADQLRNYATNQTDELDAFLSLWITAISRNVDDYCNRQFGKVAAPEQRTYRPTWDRYELKTYVEIDDIQDITSFALIDSNGTAITNYSFGPPNAVKKGQVYTRLVLNNYYSTDVRATGIWGWTDIPDSIPTAALLQGSRLIARRSSPFGIAGSPTEGSELRLLAQLDPDFKTTLKPYMRKWWAR